MAMLLNSYSFKEPLPPAPFSPASGVLTLNVVSGSPTPAHATAGVLTVSVVRYPLVNDVNAGVLTVNVLEATSIDILNDIGWHSAFWASDPDWTNPGDGNGVSSWREAIAGNDAVQATGSNQPIFRSSTATLNGQPSIEWISTDSLKTPAWTAIPQPNTVVVVAKFNAATLSGTLFDGAGGSNRHAVYVPTGNSLEMYAGSSPRTNYDTDPHLYMFEFNGASSFAYQDGAAILGPVSVGSHSLSGLTIGTFNNGSTAPLIGNIAFMGAYNGTLSAQQVADIEAWAADTYGLSIS